LNLSRFEDLVLTSSQILQQRLAILANCGIYLAMFSAIMPWPMTLAHTNEAVKRVNHAEKDLYIEKK
jgi:hypothetical protein